MTTSATCFLLQSVEPRVFFSGNGPDASAATPTAHLDAAGTLVVTGTPASERIKFTQRGGNGPKNSMLLTVRPIDGKETTFSFNHAKFASMKRIEVYAGNRKDTVDAELDTDIPTLIDGGKGDDTLRTSQGQTTLIGGQGDDRLYSQPTMHVSPHSLQAPPGLQVGLGGGTKNAGGLTITSGPDGDLSVTINGGTPQEATVALRILMPKFLLIGTTANRLEGGVGDDELFSRGGDDSLFGGAGDDRFTALNQAIETRFDALNPVSTKKSGKDTPSRVALFDVEAASDQNDTLPVRIDLRPS